MKIRTLIVDDMPLARERVRKCLASDQEIEIVAECKNGREAVAAIGNLAPDLVFLDVQMPALSGFGVVEIVGVELMPVVIFVTAYDEFALRAFEVYALDYLLKPFEDDRFERTLARAKREIKRRTQPSDLPGNLEARFQQLLGEVRETKPKYLKRIIVKSGETTSIVQTEDVDWLAAAGNYVELHAGKDVHLVRGRISDFEQKLDPEAFARIHRSTIINIDRIKTLHPLFNGDHLVFLDDGTELNMSRTYHEKLLSLLDGR